MRAPAILTARAAITGEIRRRLGDVSTEEWGHAEFTTNGLGQALQARFAAVRVAFGGVPGAVSLFDDTVQIPCGWVAYVMAKDGQGSDNPGRGVPRDVLAIAILEEVIRTVAWGRWPLAQMGGAPSNIRVESLYSGEIDTRSAVLWSVSWAQPIDVLRSDPNPADAVPLTGDPGAGLLRTLYDLTPGDGSGPYEATDSFPTR